MDITFHFNNDKINFYIKENYNLIRLNKYDDDYTLNKKDTLNNIKKYLINIDLDKIKNWDENILELIEEYNYNEQIKDFILIYKSYSLHIPNVLR